MFTVLYHREESNSDYGSSSAEFRYFCSKSINEIEKFVAECCRDQLTLEAKETLKHGYPRWKHGYGDFGFLITYNGEVLHLDSNFAGSGMFYDDSYKPDETDKIIESAPSIDVYKIRDKVEEQVYTCHEQLLEFIEKEQKYARDIKASVKRSQEEEKERQQLKALLAKYPDMVK